MNKVVISTDRLITSSEARNKFGKLLKEISRDREKYYVILDNGKVSALLVNPDWLSEAFGEDTFNLENLRKDWSRYSSDISEAMDDLDTENEKNLPKLLKK